MLICVEVWHEDYENEVCLYRTVSQGTLENVANKVVEAVKKKYNNVTVVRDKDKVVVGILDSLAIKSVVISEIEVVSVENVVKNVLANLRR